MTLAAKTRLGSFEILSLIDRGGMGEVYRARDSRLKRDVAIKVLPDSVVNDRERVARFEREARLLATMNHPNIAAIYDHGNEDGVLYLVLELVEGRTLSELILEKLPWRRTLGLFQQIALALEAAHAERIVHRDLKPGNVKITEEGIVKVLDFGLAKTLVEEAASGTRTKTAPVTVPGVGMGTPGYWSPEQAGGKSVDERTDIWSFGCCLFEALAGRHPFEDSAEADFGALPAGLPRGVRDLLRQCLEKEPSKRLGDIRRARIEIETAMDAPDEPEPSRIKTPHWVVFLVAALLAGLAVGLLLRTTAPPDPVRRFEIHLSEIGPIVLGRGPALAISPDGLRLIYVTRRGDTTALRSRAMERLEPIELPGTEGATGPVFSSSGADIAFFSQNRLQRMSLVDLSRRPLAEGSNPRGVSWARGDRILFAPETVSGIYGTTGSGSPPALVTAPRADSGERSHRWPSILPNGTHALFTVWTERGFDAEVVLIETGARKHLMEDATSPRYAPTGHLIFVRNQALMAAPFDIDHLELTGEPVSVVDGVHMDPLTGTAFYDFSEEGTLVYVPATAAPDEGVTGRLLRVSRDGKGETLLSAARGYQVPRLSPSGRRLLLTITEGDSTDIWLSEIDRGSLSRVTFEGNNGAAIWNHDGSRITFSSDRDGPVNLYSMVMDSTSNALRLTTRDNHQFPSSWSPDGRELLYTEIAQDTQLDVWVLSAASGEAKPFLDASFNESAAAFSPDGRFVAYVSDETGEDQIYVRAYDAGFAKVPISIDGGREPVWSRDGSKIFYRGQDRMMEVTISTEPSLRPGKPRLLFEVPFDEAGAPYASYEVTEDGDGFIMVRSDDELASTRILVVLNWFEELQRLVRVNR